jgi:prepilin-type N-terminal cleavage/methylation domain-containing protein
MRRGDHTAGEMTGSPRPGAGSAWRRGRGFNLLEVVAAVGIFAIGMVAVLALFAPVATSVTGLADAEAATKVSEALRAQLQSIRPDPVGAVALLLKSSTTTGHQLTTDNANPNYDISKDTQLLFASRDGTKLAAYGDALWTIATGTNTRPHPSDLEKFFEITLIRNEAISPNDPTLDASALVLAYTVRVRWPAFVPDPTNARDAVIFGSNTGGNVRFDYSQKGVLYFSGTVTR